MWRYIIGFVACPAVVIIGALLIEAIRTAFDWLYTKQKETRARAAWHYENPYWQEAFDAGVKWADDGKPTSKPNLSREKG